MNFLMQLLAFVITILVLVSIHEAGHFFVAKLLGIKVTRYAIGFGKAIFRHIGKQGTEYILAIIPLGGYVKLLDEREVIVPESEKPFAFNLQPLWSRVLVVLAGPLINFLFAIISFWLLFSIGVETYRPIVGSTLVHSIAENAGLKPGDEIIQINNKATPSLQKVVIAILERLGQKSPLVVKTINIKTHKAATHELKLKNWVINNLNPDPLKSLGIVPIRPEPPPIIYDIDKESPAANSGLRVKDHIISIDGQAIKDWYQLIDYVRLHPGQIVTVNYLRNNQPGSLKVIIGKKYSFSSGVTGYLGIKPISVPIPSSMIKLRKYSPIRALPVAIGETWQFIKFNLIIIGKMIVGDVPLSSLGGPISIFETADIAFKQGVIVFLEFLSLISIMLGFINLLPIPGLDGGHLFNFLLEFIIRKPLSLKYELITIQIGLLILIVIMLLATFNDILRLLFSG